MKHTFFILTLLIICVPLIIPFLRTGIIETQDGEWAIIRQVEMVRELKDLQFPPRWSSYLNHGYGYPLFLFTYPFPYYMGSVLRFFGFGYVFIIKILFIFSIIGSLVSMYFLSYSFWGRWGGFFSAVSFLYAPYRAINLYIRGSLGESLMLVVFPILFLSIYKLIQERKLKWFIISTMGLGILLLLHNALALLFLPFLFSWSFFLLFQHFTKRKFIIILLVYILGFMLSAYFWLPAIVEKEFISLSQTPLANKQEHFSSFQELIYSPWSLVSAKPPVQVGILHIIILGITGLLLFTKHHKERRVAGFGVVATVLTLFLMMSVAFPFWKLPVFKDIDFPWRYLAVSVFLISFIAGSIAKLKYGKWLVVIFTICLVIAGFSYIQTSRAVVKSDAYYETNDATTTSKDELMPIWVISKPKNRPADLAYLRYPQLPKVVTLLENSRGMQFNTKSDVTQEFAVNKLYFPGWYLYIDNIPVEIKTEAITGIMNITVPSGNHLVKLQFERTPVRKIADIVSLCALGALLSLWYFSKKTSLFY